MRVLRKRTWALLSIALVAGGLIWADRTVPRYEVYRAWQEWQCRLSDGYLHKVIAVNLDHLIDRHGANPYHEEAPEVLELLVAEVEAQPHWRLRLAVRMAERLRHRYCRGAHRYLAWVYRNGAGVPRDFERASLHMFIALGSENAVSMRYLIDLRRRGGNGTPVFYRGLGLADVGGDALARMSAQRDMPADDWAREGDRWREAEPNLALVYYRQALLNGSDLGVRRLVDLVIAAPHRYDAGAAYDLLYHARDRGVRTGPSVDRTLAALDADFKRSGRPVFFSDWPDDHPYLIDRWLYRL